MDKQNQKKKRKKIAILFGGKSPEHEVSVITGIQVVTNIDKEKFEAIPVYISKTGAWYIGDNLEKIDAYKNLDTIPSQAQEVTVVPNSEQKALTPAKKSSSFLPFKKEEIKDIDVIFPCFHGGAGENGGLQGLLELAEIPYVGSGILGSSLGMDKIAMKDVFKQHNIPVAKFHWFYRNDWEKNNEKILNDLENVLKYPMFIKPANAGSSIGISKVNNKKELQNGIEVAALFDRKIIVEEGFSFTKEINISVVGNSGSELTTSVCEEVYASSDFLNYDDKYKGDSSSKGMASTKRKIPAEISKELEEKIKESAKKAFQCLDCSGLARLDFLINHETGEYIVIEINTTPGSMSFYLWEASGVKFKDLITRLVDLAVERFEDTKKNTTTFSSNILENFGSGIKGPKIT